MIDGPFAVINADDYYGREAFKQIYDYLSVHEDNDKYQYAMVGYQSVSYTHLDVYKRQSLEGATIYVTLFPCNECAKAIIQSGIREVVYDCDKYEGTASVTASKRMLRAAGVTIRRYEHTGREVTLVL